MNAGVVLDAVREVLGAALALAGIIVILGGVLGLLRFPDAYNRIHATNVSHTLGAPLFVLGMAALSDSWHLAIRLILLALLLAAMAPTIAHLSASAAHAAGLTPITGAYRAPRPGARAVNRGGT
jgi:multicomponent Na+:H+ antiporter subunit G